MCHAHYEADRKRRMALGEWKGKVPAGPAVAHLARLQASGLNINRIMRITGLPERTLREMPKRTMLWSTTAEKVLAIDPTTSIVEGEPPAGLLPVIGTRRRLQSLVAIGYTHVGLARRLGLTVAGLDRLVLDSHSLASDQVRVATARKADMLWRELQHVHPKRTHASVAARKRANARGWAVPFAWDEDAIDNPNAEPQLPEDPDGAWFDDYRELRALGLTNDHIAERWGLQRESLRQRLHRLLPDDEYERYIA